MAPIEFIKSSKTGKYYAIDAGKTPIDFHSKTCTNKPVAKAPAASAETVAVGTALVMAEIAKVNEKLDKILKHPIFT